MQRRGGRAREKKRAKAPLNVMEDERRKKAAAESVPRREEIVIQTRFADSLRMIFGIRKWTCDPLKPGEDNELDLASSATRVHQNGQIESGKSGRIVTYCGQLAQCKRRARNQSIRKTALFGLEPKNVFTFNFVQLAILPEFRLVVTFNGSRGRARATGTEVSLR